MANLSNINGKFVVEQTTGYVGVGTTDPSYPIEVLNASAEIALNASGGSIYRLQSDSTDSFRINKNGVGDRLVIDGSGNSTFAGTVLIDGVSNYTGLEVKGSGSSRPQIKFSNVNQGVLGQIYGTEANALVTTTIAGLEYQVRNANGTSGDYVFKSYNTAILTLDGATNAATFAGNVGVGTGPSSDWNVLTALQVKAASFAGYSNSMYMLQNVIYNTGWKYYASSFASKIQADQGITFSVASSGISGNAITFIDAMFIKENGNVGIGETSPDDKLQIGQGHSILVGDYFQLGSGSASIMGALGWNRDTTNGVIYNTNFGAFQMHNNEGKLCLQGYNSNGANQFQHEFYNNGDIYFEGNVLIGTTSIENPRGLAQALEIEAGSPVGIILNDSRDTHPMGIENAGAVMNFTYNTSPLMTILAGGNVGIGTTSPTATLDVHAPSTTAPSLTMGAAAGQIFKNEDSELAFGLDSASPYNIWMQGRFSGNVARPFTINPLGGNVGIGTDSITAKLTVKNDDGVGNGLHVIGDFNRSAGTDAQLILGYYANGSSVTGPVLYAANSLPLLFAAGGTEKMRITSVGHILLGNTTASLTSDPGFKYIDDANVPYFGEVVNTSTGNGYSSFHHYNTNATYGGFRFYILNNGGIVNYSANNTNLSDERVKHNIENSGNYLDKICSIPVRLFNYKDEPEGTDKNLGVIAQEVEAVAPELVNNDGFGETPEDGIELKTVYSTDMMYALMKAIQELKAEIEILKNK